MHLICVLNCGEGSVGRKSFQASESLMNCKTVLLNTHQDSLVLKQIIKIGFLLLVQFRLKVEREKRIDYKVSPFIIATHI